MTTFGIEEEFVFLDRDTMRPADVAEDAFAHLAADPRWRPLAHREFLAAQVEHASAVFTRTSEAQEALVGFRREVAAEAALAGVVAASVGCPPDALPFPTITATPRYLRIVHDMAGVIADHQIQGLHVHVGIDDREQGVRALNAIRTWLPLISALTGNSPVWRGHDTGFESWRNVGQRRWTTTGCPPEFRDAADYERRLERLVGIGGMKDHAIIMWSARLSEHVPTVEVRVADAQLEAWSAVLVAVLCRALVDSVVDASLGAAASVVPAGAAAPGPELLDAALLHSARTGVTALVLDPVLGELRQADEVLDRAQSLLAPALEANGDAELVAQGFARVQREGTGATRQRAAFGAGGLPALRELYAETFAAER
ncbi:YbdK family carboxylate-amine ligase [Agromyces sp. NPDC058136]|uniref:carboxylate-amine ligase n=1 Tax=Agromyces sp. NPDC058136 TaxID=3346354 RepID=UPI0036DF3A24